MTQRHAVIVGGGIGGLCAAIGLRKAGWRVTVLERAREFTEIGAGITLWPNALRGLDALGLGGRIAPLLMPQAAGKLRDHTGRWLTRWDAARVERAFGRPLLAIHRAQFLDLLRDALPADTVHLGVEVTDVDRAGTVRWNGSAVGADLVVGADGVHSTVRAVCWPDHPGAAYCGSTGFRAVIHLPGRRELSGFIGKGVEIGLVPLTGERLYWYIAERAPRGTRHDDSRAHLLRRFAAWPEPIPELIERTPPHAILQHDLLALDSHLPSYVVGRVALLGDAAHAMPPFLGQGGCQAVEDAVVLAASLAQHDVGAGLREYDRFRRPRSQAIARQSARAGRMGSQLANPIAVAVRNAAIRLLPSAMTARAAVKPAQWSAPTIGTG